MSLPIFGYTSSRVRVVLVPRDDTDVVGHAVLSGVAGPRGVVREERDRSRQGQDQVLLEHGGLPWCRKISVLHAFLSKVLLNAAVAAAAMPDLPGC